jgi:hypothetical protein
MKKKKSIDIINTHIWKPSKCIRYDIDLYICLDCNSYSSSLFLETSLISPIKCKKDCHKFVFGTKINANILSMKCSKCNIRGGKIFNYIDLNNLDNENFIPELICIEQRSGYKIFTCGEKAMYDILD